MLAVPAGIPARVGPDGREVVTCRIRRQVESKGEADLIGKDRGDGRRTRSAELAVVEPSQVDVIAGGGILAVEIKIAGIGLSSASPCGGSQAGVKQIVGTNNR